MRFALIILCAVFALQLMSCGGSSRKSGKGEGTFSIEESPMAKNDAGVSMRVLRFKQNDTYLVLNLQLSNDSKEAVVFKNEGSGQLPGFTASAEGRSVLAERRGGAGWNPWTGVVRRADNNVGNLELSPGAKTEIEVRWNWAPKLQRRDYAWTAVVSNIFTGATKLGDLRLSYPIDAPAK